MKKENLDAIIALRHELHRHPELSLKESWTRQHLMTFLREHTDFEVVDRGAWFYAVKHTSRSNAAAAPIAFRADFDALPIPDELDVPYHSICDGVSHKCGHDGHSAALCGTALELTGEDVDRDVYLIFQHAEEIGAGGQECASLIPEQGIGEVYAYHNLGGFPEGSIVVREGLTQPASKGLTIALTGKTSHASNPEEGSNPSFAIAELVLFLREQLESQHKGMLLGTIVNVEIGTKDFGVSAGYGEVSITLRGEYEAEMEALEAALREKTEALCREHSLTAAYTVSDPFPETRNHEANLAKVRRVADRLGKPVIDMPKLWRASEDFGYYTKQCPGAIFYVGNGVDYAPLHTLPYDFNDRILETAVDMFRGLLTHE